MGSRTLIDNYVDLQNILPTWYDRTFSFDVETSSLEYANPDERLVGLAVTFEGNESYYVAFCHTQLETRTLTRVERVADGYDEQIIEGVTPKGRPSKRTKKIPRYKEVEVACEDDVPYLKEMADVRLSTALLRPFFFQPDVVMVAHNAKFDLHWLARYGVLVGGRLADTMLAAKLINENRQVGLKELAYLVGMELKHYQDLDHYPGFHKDEYLGVVFEQAWNYACLDTEAALALWGRFKTELSDEGCGRVFTQIQMPLLPVLQEMEAKGIAIDVEKVKELRAKYQAELDAHTAVVFEQGIEMVIQRWANGYELKDSYFRMATDSEVARGLKRFAELDKPEWTVTDDGYESPLILPTERSKPRVLTFNPGSNEHLGALLYDWHGLTPPEGVKIPNTNDGRPVDKNTIKMMDMALEMAGESPPILKAVVGRRKYEKQIGTYLDPMLERADPRDHHCLRTSFNQAVTDTSRLSSSSPVRDA